MSLSPDCFTLLKDIPSQITKPEKFTFPFCYQPHPLAELAVEQLQQHLLKQTKWTHNFGLDSAKNADGGKMFGVLVVEDKHGRLGFLSAFSGKLADSNLLPGFVPPVFDLFTLDGFFTQESARINRINDEIDLLEQSESLRNAYAQWDLVEQEYQQHLQCLQQQMSINKQQRKQQRQQQKDRLSGADYNDFLDKLSQQSISEKLALRDLKLHWQTQLDQAKGCVEQLNDEIEQLKKLRKKLSAKLQKKAFSYFRFLNIQGQEKDLNAIFTDPKTPVPPAGAGECAAPKLLQYAFIHGLQPVVMAEFWWGCSPKSQIRQHKKYYASCSTKCEPILAHMLEGIAMDENPLLQNPGAGKHLTMVYQDEHIVVVNKPEGLLSVPGKNINDSVYTRIREKFPCADGPLIVHRLDMSTSGLMVLALSSRANKDLQQQFVTRTVQKRYIALLNGLIQQDEGFIDLPLRQDIEDRPRQCVCYEYGKSAQTRYKVIARDNNQTRIHLYPKTGRTHQLRMHCAHVQGLNTAIVGDDLYGIKTNRLHLHAESIVFSHPVTKKEMSFTVKANF
ncbi:RluA family pseudouridine synthase [Thalassotalea aquiviva]|uniref:RluA family pseudouridine synthase n=1 Tax=Thalassotalea aquiviva TaxID=3242415 RepID=UPI00352BCF1F